MSVAVVRSPVFLRNREDGGREGRGKGLRAKCGEEETVDTYTSMVVFDAVRTDFFFPGQPFLHRFCALGLFFVFLFAVRSASFVTRRIQVWVELPTFARRLSGSLIVVL